MSDPADFAPHCRECGGSAVYIPLGLLHAVGFEKAVEQSRRLWQHTDFDPFINLCPRCLGTGIDLPSFSERRDR